MHKVRIHLDTQQDVEKFVSIARNIEEEVALEDNANHRVNAKSILGCLYSIEFEETYVTSENESTADKFHDFTW